MRIKVRYRKPRPCSGGCEKTTRICEDQEKVEAKALYRRATSNVSAGSSKPFRACYKVTYTICLSPLPIFFLNWTALSDPKFCDDILLFNYSYLSSLKISMRPYIEDEDSGAGARLGSIYIYQRQLAAEAKKSQAQQTIPQDPEFPDGILLLKPLFFYPSLKFAVRDSFLSKAGTRIQGCVWRISAPMAV